MSPVALLSSLAQGARPPSCPPPQRPACGSPPRSAPQAPAGRLSKGLRGHGKSDSPRWASSGVLGAFDAKREPLLLRSAAAPSLMWPLWSSARSPRGGCRHGLFCGHLSLTLCSLLALLHPSHRVAPLVGLPLWSGSCPQPHWHSCRTQVQGHDFLHWWPCSWPHQPPPDCHSFSWSAQPPPRSITQGTLAPPDLET